MVAAVGYFVPAVQATAQTPCPFPSLTCFKDGALCDGGAVSRVYIQDGAYCKACSAGTYLQDYQCIR